MAIEVLVPPLGQTVDTVTLVAWYKNEGEMVKQGEMLFAIETDKATLDVEAPASGVLRRVTVRAGDQVAALSAIGLIAEPEEAIAEAQPAGELAAAPDGGTVGRKERTFISPRARRLAEQHQVPIEALAATGPEGAIVERDVRAYLDQRAAPVITPVARRLAEEAGLAWRELSGRGRGGRITREDVTRALTPDRPAENELLEAIPLRSMRAIIAERMLASQQHTAQVTLMAEADATALVALRQHLAEDGVEASYNDLFLYILSRALREHPRLNASLEGETIRVWRRAHIGLAVDTERGLLVPVVRDVAEKGVAQIARETRALVERARAGQSTPDELRGGSFTLTNLGMYGIDAFTPIINLPECAILGVGRITAQPAIVNGEVVGRERVWLSLTFDHRLVDGGPAARFLQRVVQLAERPHLLVT
jgi:pyruvate dehydrogenase E2 component (dihydrolipoamide acetyltransferase)